MNENINLCELLKGHEDETFYSPLFGDVVFKNIIYNIVNRPIQVELKSDELIISFTKTGKYIDVENGECMLFPSKEQRDWNKWAEEQEPKTPKTWGELVDNGINTQIRIVEYPYDIPIVKSAEALIKIYQLIEVGYGGVPTKEERLTGEVFIPDCWLAKSIWVTTEVCNYLKPIAFHTEEQCKEFLSYPENVELLKAFYML